MLTFRTAAVVGAGLMGRRLAGILGAGGLAVRLSDVRPDVLDEAGHEARGLAAAGGSGGSVTSVADMDEAAGGADLVLEAVVEDLTVKQELFARLSKVAPRAVLASNSSVLPISQIARDVQDPTLAIGTHFWNPPDLIPIVEVVSGERTAVEVKDAVMNLLASLGKVPVWVRRDVPGFVGNRLQHALWREAISLVDDGVADAETVDLVVRGTIGLRLAQMGPIENADYVGLDLTRAIHEAVLPALDRSTEPSPLLRSLVDAGQLGAKTGQGFLTWPPGSQQTVGAALASHVAMQLRTIKEQ